MYSGSNKLGNDMFNKYKNYIFGTIGRKWCRTYIIKQKKTLMLARPHKTVQSKNAINMKAPSSG